MKPMATDLAPKIWMYWEQGWSSAPVVVQQCAISWERLNPEYQLVRLDGQTVEDYLGPDQEAMILARRCPVQLRSDIIRLLFLSRFGGVWADATLFCSRPLRNWLPPFPDNGAFFFSSPGQDRLIASWFVTANARSEIISAHLNELTSYLSQIPNLSRPTLWQRLIRRMVGWKLNRSAATTVGWWKPSLIKRSIWPYFIFHYCYNKLFTLDDGFRQLASRMPLLNAGPCHTLQMTGKACRFDVARRILADPDIPVHKLNWRDLAKKPEWEAILKNFNSLRDMAE